MSSVAVFSSAELSLSLEHPDKKRVRALGALAATPGVRPASSLEVRPAPEMVPFGIASLDAMTGGVPRGTLTEMVGPSSSGRTSVMMSLMAAVTRRQELCALIDVTDSFDPASAEAAGMDLRRILWVRCGSRGPESEAGKQQVLQDASVAGVRFTEQGSGARDHAPRVQQAITSGCFEAARGRRVLPQMNKVVPPAKNISWSIHENYDARLRHAMINGSESYKRCTPWSMEHQQAVHAIARMAQARTQNFAEEQKAKWIRLDQALKAADLLIHSGGFGLIVFDLGDIPAEQARRIPLTSWFRFRRAVESTPTMFMVLAKDSCAKTCASLVMQLSADARRSGPNANRSLAHISLLDGLTVHVELLRTRLERKPVCSASANLETCTLWKKSS